MHPNEDYVLNVLEDVGLVTRSQIENAKSRLNGAGTAIEMLVKDGVVTEADVSRSLAAQAHMDWVDLSTKVIPPEVINQIRAADARRFKVIPVGFGETGLIVAIGDPLDIDTIDSLSFLLQREIELVCASPDKIRQALDQILRHGRRGVRHSRTTNRRRRGSRPGDRRRRRHRRRKRSGCADHSHGLDASARGASLRASDIHLEPLDKKFRVRFRIDGVLQEMQAPPKQLQSAIVSRLKIMTGSMSIAEKRAAAGRPHPGEDRRTSRSISASRPSRPTTAKASSCVFSTNRACVLGLPELGFFSDDQEVFERLLQLPDGIMLVTGPTGSGKTRTLYACLNYINKPDRKIITVEDPVEYQITGINQVQVNADIGMTFPAALRSILRQAPNIIMIGEIRDLETASIAINASLTGHLVFSTLHTNDAPSPWRA